MPDADALASSGAPSRPGEVLSPNDRAELVGLLRLLQMHLGSSIESSLVPGSVDPMPEDRANVEADRCDWRRAHEWINLLGPETKRHRFVNRGDGQCVTCAGPLLVGRSTPHDAR